MGEDADLRARRQPEADQVVAEAVGPGVELAIAEPNPTRHHGGAIGNGVDHQLEQVSQIELGHVTLCSTPVPECMRRTVTEGGKTTMEGSRRPGPSEPGARRGIVGLAALVTGGGSGIGLGAATRLVRDGAHVTICGRTEERLRAAVASLEAVAAQDRDAGAADQGVPIGTAGYVVGDVTVEADVERAVGTALRQGRLDILFANAGGSMHMGPIPAADVAQVRATIDVNLVGTFLCIKRAAP